ncbi:MAG: hypothetical protein ACREOW_13010 [Thermodesulfobacteriota bacterium]
MDVREPQSNDVECLQLYAAKADESISLEAVREALSKIPGSLTVVRHRWINWKVRRMG